MQITLLRLPLYITLEITQSFLPIAANYYSCNHLDSQDPLIAPISLFAPTDEIIVCVFN